METPLRELTDVRPLGEEDRACLTELRQVLARHGALDRFGINLLHDHFPVGNDERLVETCDDRSRTLTVEVLPVAQLEQTAGRLIETNWIFSNDGDVMASLVCKVGCFVDLKDKHKHTHQRVNRV